MQVRVLERTLTELDHVRLTKLVQRHKCGRPTMHSALPIEQVLDAADIVHWRLVPPDVVTMHSRVVLNDPQAGTQSRVILCYPEDADPGAGFVSVLSPLGCSLLGQKVGATVHWPMPSGGTRSAEILGIQFQPESSGDFAMSSSAAAPQSVARRGG